MAAFHVTVKQRTACTTRHVHVTPMNDPHQDRVQGHAFCGQTVLVVNMRFLISHLFPDFLINQLAQPVNQLGVQYPQPLLKIFKPPDAQETITQGK